MWVDGHYYATEYLRGRTPSIPPSEFAYWSEAAQERINWKQVEVSDPSKALKRCVCAVAELLYSAEQGPKPGEVISESNAGYSWKAQEAWDKNAVEREIKSIINMRLGGTEYHGDFVSRAV